jgi:hypothetical protein
MDGNSRTVFSYFPRAGIIQPKFIAAAQLRKILSKNAVTAAAPAPHHCAVSLKAAVRSRAHRAGRREPLLLAGNFNRAAVTIESTRMYLA